MKRNIVILNGSPRRKGNTAALVAAFTQGAEAAGHQVTTFFLEELDLHGCRGCFGGHSSQPCPCVQKDDMANVIESLKDADMVVFASPIYWFDITAQEKAAIDRLYAFGATGFPFTKTALLLDSHSEGVYDAAIAMYKSTCAYCKWEDQGIVTISGMTERDSMASSPKLKEVRELARKLA